MLMANGIIPRPMSQQHEARVKSESDATAVEEIRALEVSITCMPYGYTQPTSASGKIGGLAVGGRNPQSRVLL
jgi:hypothetical protein